MCGTWRVNIIPQLVPLTVMVPPRPPRPPPQKNLSVYSTPLIQTLTLRQQMSGSPPPALQQDLSLKTETQFIIFPEHECLSDNNYGDSITI